MNSSNHLKSGQNKLLSVMVSAAVALFVAAVVGLWINQTASPAGRNAASPTLKLLKDTYGVHANLYKIQNMVANNQDKNTIEKLAGQQTTLLNEDIDLLKSALESNMSEDEKKFYSALLTNMLEYQKSVDRFTKLAPAGTGTPYLLSASEKMESLDQLLTELAEYETKADNPEKHSSGSKFVGAVIALVVVLLIGIVVVFSVIKKTMNRLVVEPLREATGVLREYANGRFNQALNWEADDAMGELAGAVNDLRFKIKDQVAAAVKAAALKPASAKVDNGAPSLSGLLKKSADQNDLVTSAKKAMDRLQDI